MLNMWIWIILLCKLLLVLLLLHKHLVSAIEEKEKEKQYFWMDEQCHGMKAQREVCQLLKTSCTRI